MEHIHTLYYLLSIAAVTMIIALAILIRNYWASFVLKLNEACLTAEAEISTEDKQQLYPPLIKAHCRHLFAEKELIFSKSAESLSLEDFFWQDRDLLWENRLN